MNFLSYHIDQIRQGGRSVLWRKVKAFLIMLLWLPITLPAVLLIRALRPWVVIRLGPFSSETIGCFAAHTEMYLCRRDWADKQRRLRRGRNTKEREEPAFEWDLNHNEMWIAQKKYAEHEPLIKG